MPELFCALHDPGHCVSGYRQGPTGEAGIAVADSFHRLPTRSNCLWCIEPLEADFDQVFCRLLNLYYRLTERLNPLARLALLLLTYFIAYQADQFASCASNPLRQTSTKHSVAFRIPITDQQKDSTMATVKSGLYDPFGRSNHYLTVPAPHYSAYDRINHRNSLRIQTR